MIFHLLADVRFEADDIDDAILKLAWHFRALSLDWLDRDEPISDEDKKLIQDETETFQFGKGLDFIPKSYLELKGEIDD